MKVNWSDQQTHIWLTFLPLIKGSTQLLLLNIRTGNTEQFKPLTVSVISRIITPDKIQKLYINMHKGVILFCSPFLYQSQI